MAFTTTIATPKPVAAGHATGRVGRQASLANRVQKFEPRYTTLAARNVVVRAGDATSTGAFVYDSRSGFKAPVSLSCSQK